MARKLLLLSIALFFSTSAFSQIDVVSFKESFFVAFYGWPLDDNGNPYSIIKIETNGLTSEELHMFSFSGNEHAQINPYYKDDIIWVYITAKYSDHLIITHPYYGSVDFVLPDNYLASEFEMLLLCQRQEDANPSSNANSVGDSYYVTVYDKNGNQYTTGLFISSSGKSYIRIKGNKGDEQYGLKQSNKQGFRYMTLGTSEIEPLYVK